MISESAASSVGLFNTAINSSYAACTKYAFALTETVAIAELRWQGLEYETIKQRVVIDDLLQIRSQTSRQGAVRTIWQRLEKLPPEYIYLIAKGLTIIWIKTLPNILIWVVVREYLPNRRVFIPNLMCFQHITPDGLDRRKISRCFRLENVEISA